MLGNLAAMAEQESDDDSAHDPAEEEVEESPAPPPAATHNGPLVGPPLPFSSGIPTGEEPTLRHVLDCIQQVHTQMHDEHEKLRNALVTAQLQIDYMSKIMASQYNRPEFATQCPRVHDPWSNDDFPGKTVHPPDLATMLTNGKHRAMTQLEFNTLTYRMTRVQMDSNRRADMRRIISPKEWHTTKELTVDVDVLGPIRAWKLWHYVSFENLKLRDVLTEAELSDSNRPGEMPRLAAASDPPMGRTAQIAQQSNLLQCQAETHKAASHSSRIRETFAACISAASSSGTLGAKSQPLGAAARRGAASSCGGASSTLPVAVASRVNGKRKAEGGAPVAKGASSSPPSPSLWFSAAADQAATQPPTAATVPKLRGGSIDFGMNNDSDDSDNSN